MIFGSTVHIKLLLFTWSCAMTIACLPPKANNKQQQFHKTYGIENHIILLSNDHFNHLSPKAPKSLGIVRQQLFSCYFHVPDVYRYQQLSTITGGTYAQQTAARHIWDVV
eukprot:6156810-Amphidinium_carterae.1